IPPSGTLSLWHSPISPLWHPLPLWHFPISPFWHPRPSSTLQFTPLVPSPWHSPIPPSCPLPSGTHPFPLCPLSPLALSNSPSWSSLPLAHSPISPFGTLSPLALSNFPLWPPSLAPWHSPISPLALFPVWHSPIPLLVPSPLWHSPISPFVPLPSGHSPISPFGPLPSGTLQFPPFRSPLLLATSNFPLWHPPPSGTVQFPPFGPLSPLALSQIRPLVSSPLWKKQLSKIHPLALLPHQLPHRTLSPPLTLSNRPPPFANPYPSSSTFDTLTPLSHNGTAPPSTPDPSFSPHPPTFDTLTTSPSLPPSPPSSSPFSPPLPPPRTLFSPSPPSPLPLPPPPSSLSPSTGARFDNPPHSRPRPALPHPHPTHPTCCMTWFACQDNPINKAIQCIKPFYNCLLFLRRKSSDNKMLQKMLHDWYSSDCKEWTF
ncbi:hypothetical protein C7M84_007322, partial [Penaeus vannamei]